MRALRRSAGVLSTVIFHCFAVVNFDIFTACHVKRLNYIYKKKKIIKNKVLSRTSLFRNNIANNLIYQSISTTMYTVYFMRSSMIFYLHIFKCLEFNKKKKINYCQILHHKYINYALLVHKSMFSIVYESYIRFLPFCAAAYEFES